MIKGTSDNVLQLTKYLEEQNLQYVLAVWSPPTKDEVNDAVTIFTSFDKGELKKLSDVLKDATVVKDEPKPK